MKLLRIMLIFLVLFTFLLLGFIASEQTGQVIYTRQTINVTNVVDGDTIDGDIGRIRLLGINTPEKKMPFYSEAKNFTMQLLGKEVEIETAGKDKYDRTLGYIFLGNENFNAELLEQGLASLYVYEQDQYYSELEKAEKYARDNELGLWKKSSSFGCLKLVKLDYIEDNGRCNNQEQLILENNCTAMSIILKDDANHIEKLTLEKGTFTKNYSCIWNDAGDSLYIRDDSGLILFYRY